MGPWYEQQSSSIHRHGPPPIGPDGRQIETPSFGLVTPGRSRRLQNVRIGKAGRELVGAFVTALGAIGNFVRCAGAGAAKRPPTPLTGGCR